MTTDLAVSNEMGLRTTEPGDLAPRFVISLDDLKAQLKLLEEFKREIMIPEVDYGTIPGTPKPTLLKPGAEKLSMVFGLAPTFETANSIEDWERGFFHYDERCILTSKRNGQVVASANGSANSREPRYRWRDAKPTCPTCGRDLRRSRNRDGEQGEPGWYCWKKVGGCGATWPAAQITTVGRIENPEPFELVNTIKKMAQKRALVAATLIATGGSGIWTQDIEDMPSVSGEDVVDAHFTPIDERDVDDRPRTAKRSDMVTSADDPVWKRWEALKGEAELLGVPVDELRLPLAITQLVSAGTQLNTRIEKRLHQARTRGAAEHAAPSPDRQITVKTDPLWKDWLQAEREARQAGIEQDTTAVTLPIGEESLRASIADLKSMVADAQDQLPA